MKEIWLYLHFFVIITKYIYYNQKSDKLVK